MVGAITVSVLLAILIASGSLYAMMLRLGLQWVRVENVTYRAVIGTTLAMFILQTGGYLGGLMLTPADSSLRMKFEVIYLIACCIVLPLALLMAVFRTTLRRAFLAYLWACFSSICVLTFTALAIRPFILEAFQVPTNAMAPTLRGRHLRATCPECSQPCYCSMPMETVFRNPFKMIFENFHTSEHSQFSQAPHDGDKFLVAKFVKPRRWDLVVFRYPENPKTLYVSRLVGLPGETITIENGVVHADGQPLTPPVELTGITYLSELPNQTIELSGTVRRPVKLESDESFVLGDFSASSYDSRGWSQGAPGHQPGAVPQSHLVGIVSTIYWPPERWRIFR